MSLRILTFIIAASFSLAACSDTEDNPLASNDEQEQQGGTITTTITDQGTAGDSSRPMARDFALHDMAGNQIQLSALRGKPVMLNFWATWCGPCVAEMPAMKDVHQELGEQVHFVCVNLRESQGTIENFLSGKGYNWTFVMDSNAAVAEAYEIHAIPTTYVIDASGRVAKKHVGSMNAASMRSLIREGM